MYVRMAFSNGQVGWISNESVNILLVCRPTSTESFVQMSRRIMNVICTERQTCELDQPPVADWACLMTAAMWHSSVQC